MPRFSLVIPTLQRSNTLRHSLATLVNQTYDDFEIIVQNNGRDGATEAVVDNFNDNRIRHCWSDHILPMADNWEAALANAGGEYITVVGDDDGLFPDACWLAADIFARTNVEILSWRPFCYCWPSHIHPEKRNRLIADIDSDVKIRLMSSRNQLQRFYRFVLHYSQLPMIYNSFVARKAIERVISRGGRYFLGALPDVASGIVNAESTEEFAFITRPLSMAGISGHSVGHTVTLSPPGWTSPERVERELGVVKTDPRLVPTNNLELMIAGDAFMVRDRLFPHDKETECDFRRLIQSVASAINDRPGFYDTTHAAIEALAKKHDVSLSDIAVPKVTNAQPQLICGTVTSVPGQISMIIDGNEHGLHAIDDAIRLAGQLMPKVENAASLHLQREASDRAILLPGAQVSFCVGENGVCGLDYGWGEAEQWGTWSIGKHAHLRIATTPVPSGPIHVKLRFRAFLHVKHPRIEVVFIVNGSRFAALTVKDAGTKAYRLVLPSGSYGADGALDLELRISNPCSPIELGASADTRLLGIGLESMVIQSRWFG
jgi:hypothetical protein